MNHPQIDYDLIEKKRRLELAQTPYGQKTEPPGEIDFNQTRDDPGLFQYGTHSPQGITGPYSQEAPLPVEDYPLNAPAQAPQAKQGTSLPLDSDEMTRSLMEGAKAKAHEGYKKAIAAEINHSQLKDTQGNLETHSKAIMNESLAIARDMAAKHIDEKQFLHPQNLGTAIGLILGGMGGAVTGQGNPAQRYLEHEQELYIKAQTANMTNSHNLLSFYNQMFGNLKDAQNMLRIISNDQMAAKFEEAAGTAKGQTEKENAIQEAIQWRTKNGPLVEDLARKRMLKDQIGQGKEVQPGLAASVLAPSEKVGKEARAEVKEQEEQNTLATEALSNFDKIVKLQKLSNRLTNPIQSKRQIDALWDALSEQMTRKIAKGVPTVTRLKLIEGLKGHVFDSEETTRVIRNEIERLMTENKSTPTLDYIGVKVPKALNNFRPRSR